jgi:hypothetical protein
MNAATSTTTAANATVNFSATAQAVTLTATVAGPLNGGSVTFTVAGIAGASCTDNSIAGGTASCQVTLPANQAKANYTITATYSGTADVNGSNDTATLKIQ